VYFVLVPFMIFFMLKDKDLIARWFGHFLPAERGLIKRVWDEVYEQLGNYVRGKVAEIIIVGVGAWIIFAWMGLNYAALLGVIVGVSVIVPYVGPTIAIIPLAFVGFFQWGWGSQFIYLMVGYVALQAFDGNILIPLLFSEVVNLHPLAIIIAVVFFGGLWGFWGVFFAIPLGILIKAVLNAWPAAE
jgi:putative permease